MDKPISLLPRQPAPLGTDRVPVVRTSEIDPANRNQYSTVDDLAGYLADNLTLTGTEANEFFIGESQSQSQDVEYRVLVRRTLEGAPGYAEGIRWQSTPAGLVVERVVCKSYQSPPGNPLNVWEIDAPGGSAAEEITQVATRTMAGITAGTTYTYLDDANGRTLKAALTPDQSPTVGLTADGAEIREPGSPLAVTLTITVEPQTNPLQSIILTGPSISGSRTISVGDGTLDISTTENVTANASGKSEWVLTVRDSEGAITQVKDSVTITPYYYLFYTETNPQALSDGDLSDLLKEVGTTTTPGDTPGFKVFRQGRKQDTIILPIGDTPKYVTAVYEETSTTTPVVTQNNTPNTGYTRQIRTLLNSVNSSRPMHVLTSGDKQVGDTTLKID